MSSDLNATPPAADPRSFRRWVLASSILASGMAFIDSTALSVAMPALQADLAATGADLLWINNGFALPLAALLLLGGALGDGFGRKRIFTLGILAFAAGICGFDLFQPAVDPGEPLLNCFQGIIPLCGTCIEEHLVHREALDRFELRKTLATIVIEFEDLGRLASICDREDEDSARLDPLQ